MTCSRVRQCKRNMSHDHRHQSRQRLFPWTQQPRPILAMGTNTNAFPSHRVRQWLYLAGATGLVHALIASTVWRTANLLFNLHQHLLTPIIILLPGMQHVLSLVWSVIFRLHHRWVFFFSIRQWWLFNLEYSIVQQNETARKTKDNLK